MKYLFDMRVYSQVLVEELPFKVPNEANHNGLLPAGMYQLEFDLTADAMEKLVDETLKQGDYKIIGVHKLETI